MLMGLTQEQRSAIQVEVKDLALDVTAQVYGGNKLDEVRARVNSYYVQDDDFKGQTWAGRCQYSLQTLQMNLLLCTSEDRYRGVLAHEYAHAVAEALFGRDGTKHGPRWQNIMVRMDRRPEQYHRFNTAPVGKPNGSKGPRVTSVRCRSCSKMVQVPSFALRPGVAARCPKCRGYAK